MSEPTTEANKTTTDTDQQSSFQADPDRINVQERDVQHPGNDNLNADNILDQVARGVRVVDSATAEEEARERERRIGRAAGAVDFDKAAANTEAVFERGYASDEYVKSLERGYAGFTAEVIPDEAFSVAGVTSNPEVAAQSGKQFVGVKDIHELTADRNAAEGGSPTEAGKAAEARLAETGRADHGAAEGPELTPAQKAAKTRAEKKAREEAEKRGDGGSE